MIDLIITQTGKTYNPKDVYKVFNEERESFKTMKEAKEYLKETYGKSRKDKIYIDDAEGQAHCVGYLYRFRNKDYHRGGKQRWLQRDWVVFMRENLCI